MYLYIYLIKVNSCNNVFLKIYAVYNPVCYNVLIFNDLTSVSLYWNTSLKYYYIVYVIE